MINAYGLNGMGYEAIQLYHRMPAEMRNEKSHVCVLNACSHSGLVNECRSIFTTIPNKSNYIYTTIIDCLSRSFFFDEAMQLIEEFERHQPPYLPMYMSLLSGARNQNDVSLARQITERIKQLDHVSDDCLSSASVLFGNTLASSGDLEEASKLRLEMNQSGIGKKVGLSWTEVNGEIVEFRVKDRRHPRTKEIYDELHRIEKELIEHGHKFDASWITREMMPDETVASILNSHSERLALAYHFIQRPVPSHIQIVKNLRICGDCHGAIKLISKIRRCEILIRDANRIHHFSDGKCSCAALPLDNLYLRKPVYLQMQEELARTLTYDIYNFLSPHSRTNKYLGVSNDPTSGNIRSLGVFNVTVIVGGVQTTNIGFVDYKCFYLHEG
ncbi:unnamed protein product [Adineta ricciae]|uniref:DYW domain-containing protein n=1 Tax=Adineta ricciae TaxID=249248 RepID=A0A815IS67_ADIRI|nr:unnamed protein product [Adineta ricciae]